MKLGESIDHGWGIAELARKIAPSGAEITAAMMARIAFLVSVS